MRCIILSYYFSIRLVCSNVSCGTKVQLTIACPLRKMAVISITGETSCRGDVDEEDASSQLVGHQSSVAAREAVAEELSAGVGPTEAYENVACATKDAFLTKDAVRAQSSKLRRKEVVPQCWPRDTMLCLVLLKEVQKEEISPEEPVSGYIQVRNECLDWLRVLRVALECDSCIV